jgi:hypothetical protein
MKKKMNNQCSSKAAKQGLLTVIARSYFAWQASLQPGRQPQNMVVVLVQESHQPQVQGGNMLFENHSHIMRWARDIRPI